MHQPNDPVKHYLQNNSNNFSKNTEKHRENPSFRQQYQLVKHQKTILKKVQNNLQIIALKELQQRKDRNLMDKNCGGKR